MPLCQACLRTVTENDILTCQGCKDAYHHQCLNMKTAYYTGNIYDLKRKWKCEPCSNVTHRKGDETPASPVHKAFPSPSSENTAKGNVVINEAKAKDSAVSDEVASEGSVTLMQIAQLLDSKFDEKLGSKLAAIEANLGREIKKELNKYFDKIKSDFNKSFEFLSGQISDVKSNVDIIENRLLKLENENTELTAALKSLQSQAQVNTDASSLKTTIIQLHSELNDRDQATLLNDVEITGVPEFPGESVVNIVTSTASKLGVKLDARDVVYVAREGVARSAAGAVVADGRSPAAGAAGARPRRIVIRLARQALRNDLLHAARVRRDVTTSDLGLPQHVPARMYINERLTRANRVLLGKAREAKRELGWRFVWTKEGRIYARRDDTPSSRAQRLRNEDDLERVFGKRPKAQTD